MIKKNWIYFRYRYLSFLIFVIPIAGMDDSPTEHIVIRKSEISFDLLQKAAQNIPDSYDTSHLCLKQIDIAWKNFSGVTKIEPTELTASGMLALEGARLFIKNLLNLINNQKILLQISNTISTSFATQLGASESMLEDTRETFLCNNQYIVQNTSQTIRDLNNKLSAAQNNLDQQSFALTVIKWQRNVCGIALIISIVSFLAYVIYIN